MSSFSLRLAQEADLVAINDIYNHYVLHSTCTYQTEPETIEARRAWFAAHGEGYPVIVGEHDGEVVGWVLNHEVQPGVVRFTCSFMRKEISRRGRIIPLYQESLRRLVETGCRRATFVTPVIYPNMIRFIHRWLVPIAEFVGETRGSRKSLRASQTAAESDP